MQRTKIKFLVLFLMLICVVFFLIKINTKNKTDLNHMEQAVSTEEKYESEYFEGNGGDAGFVNPYFYSQRGCFLTAEIQYIDFETVKTINGELELQWLKEYDDGNLYKLTVEPVGDITDYLGEERLNIYFYVTSDKIYRLWSYSVHDDERIEFYNNDTLLMETLNTDEKLIENGELVCCMEGIPDELEAEEVGKHVTIVQNGEQITYNRVDIGQSGNREFYESFVWEKGKGLVGYQSGYRVESEILYIDNIFVESSKKDSEDTECFSTPEEIAALGLPEDMLAYWMVLNNKKPFISMNEDKQKFYLNEYCWYLNDVNIEYHADYFMIVDMDGDGLEEVVLECTPGTSQVLHYEEGEVYSYQFGIRAMKRIHINGIYDASGGAASNYYLRLTELNKDGYTEEMLVKMIDDYYEVEGEETTQEECSAYVDSIESVELAERMEFTEDMLDQQLLENLSEQEIALVKSIPAENMIKGDPNFQEHKLTLQLYAAVLTGEEDVIYVTGDTFWEDTFGDELTWVYFSIVDMDGDGVQELVFTSDYGIIRILHYEEGQVYCYQFRPLKFVTSVITTDGVFQTDELSSTGYARIVSFNKDGYEIEPVEDYESSNHDRIRYYFFSEETINQWLK